MDENESKSSPRNDVGFRGIGLRFSDSQTIESKSHRVYKINLDSNAFDLSVTLVYLDPPLDVDNEAILFADLDLYVKSPSGEIYYGNNITEGDPLACIERVVLDREEIASYGGEYEIHVISNKYPIESQRVMFSIVVNGPFEMGKSEKNAFILTAEEAADEDCPDSCNGNGKCDKGRCVCFGTFIGPYCNINPELLNDGSSHEATFKYRDIRYFMMPLKEKEGKVEKISFDIVKNYNEGPAYFCTSFASSPGKMTDPSWECHEACPPLDADSNEHPFFANYTFNAPQEEDPEFFHLSVYTGYYDDLTIGINNIKFTVKQEQPTQAPTSKSESASAIVSPTDSSIASPSDFNSAVPTPTDGKKKSKKKISTLAIPLIVVVVVLVVVAILILAFVLFVKSRTPRNNSTINLNLIADQDPSGL